LSEYPLMNIVIPWIPALFLSLKAWWFSWLLSRQNTYKSS